MRLAVSECIALLREAEWASGGSFGPSGDDQELRDVSCFFCDAWRETRTTRSGYRISGGHEPGCKLAELLRRATEEGL
jgi:hypothetical protein